ncbi:MAG: hypothetical protein IPI67_04405 [Myxococcales bacterium]|nr:hypothetical protein [Myxococcales bacterium]
MASQGVLDDFGGGAAQALRDLLLECDVPAWTPRDAREWWREHGTSIATSGTRVNPQAMAALDVDFAGRGSRGA